MTKGEDKLLDMLGRRLYNAAYAAAGWKAGYAQWDHISPEIRRPFLEQARVAIDFLTVIGANVPDHTHRA